MLDLDLQPSRKVLLVVQVNVWGVELPLQLELVFKSSKCLDNSMLTKRGTRRKKLWKLRATFGLTSGAVRIAAISL